MNGMFSQLRRGIGLRFWLSIAILVCLIFATFLQPVLFTLRQRENFQQGYHNELVMRALSSRMISSFLPTLAAIPLASGYLDEVKSKFVRFCLIRENYANYLFNHCFSCWVCGGGAVLCGTLLAWGITILSFMPIEQSTVGYRDISFNITAKIMLMFLCGGFWAVVGMTISAFMESQYIAYVSSFVIYYLLIIFCERYLPNAFLLYPLNWTKPDVWPFGTLGATIFLLELTAICGIVFIIRAGKRLREL